MSNGLGSFTTSIGLLEARSLCVPQHLQATQSAPMLWTWESRSAKCAMPVSPRLARHGASDARAHARKSSSRASRDRPNTRSHVKFALGSRTRALEVDRLGAAHGALLPRSTMSAVAVLPNDACTSHRQPGSRSPTPTRCRVRVISGSLDTVVPNLLDVLSLACGQLSFELPYVVQRFETQSRPKLRRICPSASSTGCLPCRLLQRALFPQSSIRSLALH